jgi:uncharacterized membrane protein YbhN (UPF0104 family)
VFTGGAVRYRIYSAWGLKAIEVAKICFVAGLTFWLGNATVLGLGIAFEPLAASAINQLPEWLNRACAIMILMVLTLYVVWVWRRPRIVGRNDWSVILPAGPFVGEPRSLQRILIFVMLTLRDASGRCDRHRRGDRSIRDGSKPRAETEGFTSIVISTLGTF